MSRYPDVYKRQGKYNIQVNAIAPGAHKTDMYWDAVKIDPVLMETRTKQCPLQRAGEVTEMWHVCLLYTSLAVFYYIYITIVNIKG